MKALFTKFSVWNGKARRWLGVPLDSIFIVLLVTLVFAIKNNTMDYFLLLSGVLGVIWLAHFAIFILRKKSSRG